jgi:Family of unknown function (DUF6502)
VGFDESGGSFRSKRNVVRVVARKAILQIFDALAGFVIDAGLSTNELHSVLREAAVRSVATRQLEGSHRINISGIAATTGIPRAEISRILKSRAVQKEQPINRQQKSTNRILAAWHEEPKFTDSNGHPADLRLYGRGATFESLVKAYGRGIPTRALLDELLRARAVEVLSSQKIRAKALFAIDRGISPQAIKAFGDRATELLSTMLSNMKEPDNTQFIASVSGSIIAPNSLPIFRKELSVKGAEFLAGIQESLTQKPILNRGIRTQNTVSVTIFCHESFRKRNYKKNSSAKRTNFRRNS